jgi:diguanylate cyclase (GGDEF)-like protein
MGLLEAFKLKSKLFFVFVLINIGLFAIGVVGFININDMKKNIDRVYFGSLVPVTELSSILQTYYGELSHTLHRYNDEQISQGQASSQIEDGVVKIKKRWKSYSSHFKRDEEMEYIEYAQLELDGTNNYFLHIVQLLNNDNEEGKKISLIQLEKHLSNINGVLQKLIKYEVEVARYERKNFLQSYDVIKMQLIVALAVIIFIIIGIVFYVFRGISYDHTRLKRATLNLKKANKRLEEVSYTDALTSLYNRRYFNLVYERELKRAKRDKESVTFMMLDIDYFKQYNDTYGHLEGDNALVLVAKTLKEKFQRPTDYIFRLGGEEFGVLFTQSEKENSKRLADEMCVLVKSKKLEHKGSKIDKFLTLSIGVAWAKAEVVEDEDKLLALADKMLYEAKEGGRNRAVIATYEQI